ncbi:19811_t:CDS:10 [Cetraspora pellucida]|uniref:Coatomer subunit beta n=2 Tax=Gigasporaceae TaxID=36753 RepID=A0A9N9BED8_9GLOM|nr:19811_t:CDS:10 [Cetraspora pellucida]
MATETCYTIIHQDDSLDQPSLQELKTALEKGSEEAKIDTMKKILVTMLNGDPFPQLLMHVIRFVMPSKNKTLKKLLHFYWEICPKTNPDGKLKQEMILVWLVLIYQFRKYALADHLKNIEAHCTTHVAINILYIRGATLRFLCKLREPELLEPLLPSCRSCLEHRHSYVRKNAVFAIYTIYKHFEYLIPDAPELIQSFLAAEADQTCKRNAFVMLCNTNQLRAVEYLNDVFDQVPNFDELLQLSGKYIRCIFELLNAASHSVKYEAATSLMALTHAPAAVKAAASCYIELIIKESDNNVKLIVLDRLDELREKHEQTLDDLVLDILRVLTSTDIEVRRKALRIGLELVSSRNVQEVVVFLKKELSKTLDQDYEKNNEYRQLLIQSIHGCAIKFSEVAANVVHVLMEFLGDSNNPAAIDVIAFVREVVEKFPNLRSSITEKLLETFMDVKSGKVFRGALWIVGEYCTECQDIEEAWKQIRTGLGEIPILASEQLVLRYAGVSKDAKKTNALRAEAMLIMASVIRVGQSQFVSTPIDEDSYDRIMSCLHVLEQFSIDASIKSAFLQDTKAAFARIVEAEEKRTAAKKAKDKSVAAVQVDDLISFRQFSKRNLGDEADEYELDLTRATGQSDPRDDLISKLSRVVQLTGFSDPVYAEAYVNVHQYDILLDVLIVNQTSETLQNLSIEFATLGDLKLVERPTQHNLAPHSFHSVKATIKVSSTETGVIFGNIVYDGPGTSESNCVVLNDIHIDIMDYINPAYCNETQFRSMWTEFEWENKVNVNTNITDLREYLSHIMKSTNMSCLTPETALSGNCGFLSANMYARSIFGEDALANLSVEKQTDGAIAGHVRIRSKTQGIALSLGDKITLAQKALA